MSKPRVTDEQLQAEIASLRNQPGWAVDTDKRKLMNMMEHLADARRALAASEQRCRELEAQIEQLALENGRLGYAVKSPELYQCVHESLAAQRQKEGE